MQYAFFDTSALVKRYYEESGTETVDGIVENDETTIVITSLSVVEAVSAFRRKYNARRYHGRQSTNSSPPSSRKR